MLLDRHQHPDRQPDRFLVVDVHEARVAPGGFPAALDADDLGKKKEFGN